MPVQLPVEQFYLPSRGGIGAKLNSDNGVVKKSVVRGETLLPARHTIVALHHA
jgi:hypothetical protein